MTRFRSARLAIGATLAAAAGGGAAMTAQLDSLGDPHVVTVQVTVPHQSIPAAVVASCLGTERATGGGYFLSSHDGVVVRWTAPLVLLPATPTGWQVGAYDTTPDNATLKVYAVCVPVQ